MSLEKVLKEARKDRLGFYRSANVARVYVMVNGVAYCCPVPGQAMLPATFTPDDVLADDWEMTHP